MWLNSYNLLFGGIQRRDETVYRIGIPITVLYTNPDLSDPLEILVLTVSMKCLHDNNIFVHFKVILYRYYGIQKLKF